MKKIYLFILGAAVALSLACSAFGYSQSDLERDRELCLESLKKSSATDWDKYISACNRAIDNGSPNYIMRHFLFGGRANAYYYKGLFSAAIADWNSAIGAKNRPTVYHLLRGVAYQRLGDLDHAIADYNLAIQWSPENALARFIRGHAHFLKGAFDLALSDMNEALVLRPNFPEAYRERGLIRAAQGQFSAAIAEYEQALNLAPKSPYALVDLGNAYRENGDFNKAVETYEKAISLKQFPAAYSNRGVVYERQGNTERAQADFRAALAAPLSENEDEKKYDDPAQTLARVRLTSVAEVKPGKPSAPEAIAQMPLAAQGRRVALVIGNSSYPDVGKLANPAADARMVAAALRHIGFAEVIERYDLDLAGMSRAVKEFGDTTADADWAVVYYAGHGIEVSGVSYLVPTDAKLLRDSHVADEALPLERVLAKVENAKKLRLVILDACRNNPFAARMVRSAGSTRSIGRGLAPLEPEGGVLVAYSAKHGTLAQDGDGANSPFATALAAYLEEPGLEIQFLFRKVRDRVKAATGGAQEPFLYGSLGAEPLYFAK